LAREQTDVTGSPLTALHRDLIVTLASRYRLPAVYSNRFFIAAGGLVTLLFAPCAAAHRLESAGRDLTQRTGG
jgi:hypothetical protein